MKKFFVNAIIRSKSKISIIIDKSVTLYKKSIVIINGQVCLADCGLDYPTNFLSFNAIAKFQSKWKFSSLTQLFTTICDHRTFLKLLLDECGMQCCRGDARIRVESLNYYKMSFFSYHLALCLSQAGAITHRYGNTCS